MAQSSSSSKSSDAYPCHSLLICNKENSSSKGASGEEAVARYLREHGFKILERNFTVRFSGGPIQGEIDIIAAKDGIVSFVEVKSVVGDISRGFGDWVPEDRVNFQKQRKIARAMEVWLNKHPAYAEHQVQIDVAAVLLSPSLKESQIRYSSNAVSA